MCVWIMTAKLLEMLGHYIAVARYYYNQSAYPTLTNSKCTD